MKRVYISGPISLGDLRHNIEQASAAFMQLASAGLYPLCPHWSCFAGPVLSTRTGGLVYAIASAKPNGLTQADWMRIDLAWLRLSDVVLRLPGDSEGADRETAEAESLGIPVYHTVWDVIAWSRRCDDVVVS